MQISIFLLMGVALASQYPWIRPDDLNRGLPESISLYTLNTSSSPFGTKLTGAYAKINLNDSNLQFIVKDTNMDALGYFPKTPKQYADVETNIVYAVINGGYFNMVLNTSASFLAEVGKIKAKNLVNTGGKNFPTVGAFGNTTSNKFSAEYIYSYGAQMETYTFRYPNHFPGPEPNIDDGLKWSVHEGIGAGPILLKSGEVIKGDLQNFGTSMIDVRHPRSAICVDRNNYLYMVAIDGRYDGSDGLKMVEIADVMRDLNCYDAMNLDGGGSTCLFANNKILNRPSDAGGPRPVVSAVLIRDKFKRKMNLMMD